MTASSIDRTPEGFFRSINQRLISLERRLGGSSSGGSTSLAEGPGIDITGLGTSGSPYVISADAPVLPAPQQTANSSAFTVTASPSAWQDIINLSILTITPQRDLWVRVDFTAMTFATAGYTAIGVAYSVNGGAYSIPQDDAVAGVGVFGQSPFNVVRDSATGQTGLRMLKLTAGSTYAFKMQAMRSSATGSQQANYAFMRLIPMYWADVPVPVRVTTGALTRRLSAANQAVSTTGITILYGTAVSDSGHFTYNATTGAFTCVIPGTYRITANVGFSTATASFALVNMRLNGANLSSVIAQRSTTLQVGATLTGTATLVVGDVIDVAVASNVTNGNTDTTVARTFIELVPITLDDPSVGTPTTDSGWQTLALNTGWVAVSGGLRARRIGNVVNIQGRVTSPSIAANSTVDVLSAVMPTQFIPTLGSPLGFPASWSSGESSWGVVNAVGMIQVRRAVAGVQDLFVNITYFV